MDKGSHTSSVLYRCNISHHRKEPIVRNFNYNIFMWYLNLDDLSSVINRLWLVSRNRFNYYAFKDGDHMNTGGGDDLKSRIRAFVKANDETANVDNIMLLTNLTTLGYLFNPVSFYFCFDNNGQPLCAIAEVGNTYGEMKPYFIGKENIVDGVFRFKARKYFYVSPFIDHDTELDFFLGIPGDKLNLRIDDYKGDNRFFTAVLDGTKDTLSNRNVLISALKFPLITIRIIVLIHLQAAILWLKKLPYHSKEAFPELQRGVYNKYKSKGN